MKLCLKYALLFLTTLSVFSAFAFVNYDNDPDLNEAFRHDSEYAVNQEDASRIEAEASYLRYLEKNNLPSFQQAKVYCQLGVMYTTTAIADRGEDVDYYKARMYFEKVLELEPERIGNATIRARTFLASLPDQSSDDNISKGLDVYEWASAITKETLQKNWLPNRPEETEIPRLVLLSMDNYIPNIVEVMAGNSLALISRTEDRDLRLKRVSERFSGMPIAAWADAMAKGMSLFEGAEIYNNLAPSTLDVGPSESSSVTNNPPEYADTASNNSTSKDQQNSVLTVCLFSGLSFFAGLGIGVLYLRKKK